MEEVDEILLDVLNQSCGDGNGEIDNRCMSAYEEACEYLKKKDILIEVNSRIYNIKSTQLLWDTQNYKNSTLTCCLSR